MTNDDTCTTCNQPATHPSHFDETDLGCTYVSPATWAAQQTTTDHHAAAERLREQLRAKEDA